MRIRNLTAYGVEPVITHADSPGEYVCVVLAQGKSKENPRRQEDIVLLSMRSVRFLTLARWSYE